MIVKDLACYILRFVTCLRSFGFAQDDSILEPIVILNEAKDLACCVLRFVTCLKSFDFAQDDNSMLFVSYNHAASCIQSILITS